MSSLPPTLQMDPRFPNQNQTKCCYFHYVDYFRCRKVAGDNDPVCNYFKDVYTKMCPKFWVETWDEQRANGTFAGRIE